VIVNKVNVVDEKSVRRVLFNVRKINKNAKVIMAASEVIVDNPDLLRGRKVLIVEDGPSVTHGGLGFGAGYIAAKKYGAEIVNPKEYAIGSIRETYKRYDHICEVLPALGYGERQMRELEEVINKIPADIVVLGTPTDISRYLRINKPVVRVSYELKEVNRPSLEEVIDDFLHKNGLLTPSP